MHWRDEGETRAFAKKLAAHPGVSDAYIELQGDLGAGKTSFVRHLLRSLGVEGRIKSPTYAVVEPYVLPSGSKRQLLNIWHFDFYRFNDPREWEEAGFRELFASPGLKLAEWADKARGMLPQADLVIHLAVLDNDVRQAEAIAQTPKGRELLA
ncbi:MAG: tRNA (adenosine(37)-N6)-threonylcarbamoyltransferase complex ATPase subunit type 1 TsaE [Betaproteobacteria bacterium]|jgi:tRNA threonylcarbamoyladenosine biosynthesis protein TsaE|nr:tRNA (adenosine(37)-N6)-threonylcarbamoyltransferase complex ATPase subunit type 1 TsaE [Betaproteobacteria bacterium]MBK7654082.1 tRNA (adenosine(37)-N6)-threonylcarbamoyltransferase complex ATPase subunit type 1 TsaE [Betaproteobacteria bacterium]